MQPKNKILATGLSGMVGTRIKELLSDTYEFEDLSRTSGIDITNTVKVAEAISSSAAPIILHLAAKTDVDACEDDKILGEDGEAWMVNVIGTENVVAATRKSGKKLIYISTDFVFNGSKDFYSEGDEPDPTNWYGETKYIGERKVIESDTNYIILRISHPYCAITLPKKDFVHRIIKRFENHQKVMGVTDFYFTPTYIDDIAEGLEIFFSHDVTGVYHLGGSQKLTPYEAFTLVADELSYDKSLLTATTRSVFFKDRAFRPFKIALKNDKIAKLGIHPRSFIDGMREFKR